MKTKTFGLNETTSSRSIGKPPIDHYQRESPMEVRK